MVPADRSTRGRGRVLRERMIARARFVDTRFTDFGPRFAIEPPEDVR